MPPSLSPPHWCTRAERFFTKRPSCKLSTFSLARCSIFCAECIFRSSCHFLLLGPGPGLPVRVWENQNCVSGPNMYPAASHLIFNDDVVRNNWGWIVATFVTLVGPRSIWTSSARRRRRRRSPRLGPPLEEESARAFMKSEIWRTSRTFARSSMATGKNSPLAK